MFQSLRLIAGAAYPCIIPGWLASSTRSTRRMTTIPWRYIIEFLISWVLASPYFSKICVKSCFSPSFFLSTYVFFWRDSVCCSVVDPHYFNADPDSIYHPDADPDPYSDFYWCGSGFLFDADPDPTFRPDSDPDPDPSFQLKAQTSVPDPNPDPDPHVFGPSWSGSTSQRYGSESGSGSFYHHAIMVWKTLNPTILWLFLTFYFWKMM